MNYSKATTLLISMLMCACAATEVFAADPAPASAPTSGAAISSDPLPASPPMGMDDPEPASAPLKSTTSKVAPVANDPALAFAPGSTDPPPANAPSSPVMTSGDPAPAVAPGSTSDESSSASSVPPFLGVGFRDPGKPIVTTLWGDSTAVALGIKLGDEIVSLNDQPVSGIESLRAILAGLSNDDSAEVVIKRDGKNTTLGPLPFGKGY